MGNPERGLTTAYYARANRIVLVGHLFNSKEVCACDQNPKVKLTLVLKKLNAFFRVHLLLQFIVLIRELIDCSLEKKQNDKYWTRAFFPH